MPAAVQSLKKLLEQPIFSPYRALKKLTEEL